MLLLQKIPRVCLPAVTDEVYKPLGHQDPHSTPTGVDGLEFSVVVYDLVTGALERLEVVGTIG